MKRYKMIGWDFIISEKLKRSMSSRISESVTGRVIVPTDIINRLSKENLNNSLIDINGKFYNIKLKDFCIDFYNIRCDLIEVNENKVGLNDE